MCLKKKKINKDGKNQQKTGAVQVSAWKDKLFSGLSLGKKQSGQANE